MDDSDCFEMLKSWDYLYNSTGGNCTRATFENAEMAKARMQTKWSMDVHRHYAKQHETLQLPWIRRHFAALSGAYALYFAFCVAAAYIALRN